MKNENQNFESALSNIRHRRLAVFISFISLFLVVAVCKVFEVPETYLFFIIVGGVIFLMPLMAFTGLSTCPRCNSNYFGGFYKIENNKCSKCGLGLNEYK